MTYINDFRPELSSGSYSFVRDVFADEATFQKVHKHLSDENDVITDQDIENIKTEIAVRGDNSDQGYGYF